MNVLFEFNDLIDKLHTKNGKRYVIKLYLYKYTIYYNKYINRYVLFKYFIKYTICSIHTITQQHYITFKSMYILHCVIYSNYNLLASDSIMTYLKFECSIHSCNMISNI